VPAGALQAHGMLQAQNSLRGYHTFFTRVSQALEEQIWLFCIIFPNSFISERCTKKGCRTTISTTALSQLKILP
jgi:hypothetical protein